MLPENQELGRQRPAPGSQISVDARRIGLEPGARRRRQMRQARVRPPIEPERAHEAIGRQRCRADDLGQPAGADPPLELHLPEPVLGMDEAEREHRIQEAPRLDVRDRPPIAHHRDRRRHPRNPDLPFHLRQRAPQPEIPAAQPHRAHDQKPEQPPPEPAAKAAQVSPARSRLRAGPDRDGAAPVPGSGGHRTPAPRRR